MDYLQQQKVMLITSINNILTKYRGHNLNVQEFDSIYDSNIQDIIHEYNILVTLRLRQKQSIIAQSL